MTKFSNSHILSTKDLDTYVVDMVAYSGSANANICRCLNCGADGISHLSGGVCYSWDSGARYIHRVDITCLESAYFECFRRDTEAKQMEIIHGRF